MDENISSALEYALEKLSYPNIRDYQRKVVENYLHGKDVLFCAPTGSGKSLTFEVAPFVFHCLKNEEKCIVIVVSPLTSLMRSKCTELQKKNVRAAYLRDILAGTDTCEPQMFSKDDIKKGNIDIIFASPESLLDHQRDIVLELSKQNRVKALFVDEAHCIKKFGKPDLKKKKPPYRPCYGKLGELRSLIGGRVPIIALTATATQETKGMIKQDLCMNGCTEVIMTPDKKNITYWLHTMEKDEIDSNFQWLVELLFEKKSDTPRMIIFFRQIKHIAEVYELLETSLGENAYVNYNPQGPNDDRNRLFDMFHMKTDDNVKDSICASYQDPNGCTRVVLSSTSFSMGLDVKNVDTVIHYGPPNDIDDYLQESGRAGRNPETQCNAILLKYKRCLGSQNISSSMKEYVKTMECRRQFILNAFDTNKEEHIRHLCCDNCKRICSCSCTCDDNCECQVKCTAEVPSILYAIQQTRYNRDSGDTESDISSGSEVDTLSHRTPRIIYSSSDESF